MEQKCSKTVFHTGGTFRGSPCKLKGKVLREGRWYCAVHDPLVVDARRSKAAEERSAAFRAKQAQEERERTERNRTKARGALAPDLAEALREIDRTLAEHPDATRGNSKVHFAMHRARAAAARFDALDS